jgi:hypothetical protein
MQEAIISGTVLPDGSLKLSKPVPLPPGPVEVSVRAPGGSGNSILQVLQDIWEKSRRAGLKARSGDEIDAEIESIRQAAAEEIHEIGEFAQPTEDEQAH